MSSLVHPSLIITAMLLVACLPSQPSAPAKEEPPVNLFPTGTTELPEINLAIDIAPQALKVGRRDSDIGVAWAASRTDGRFELVFMRSAMTVEQAHQSNLQKLTDMKVDDRYTSAQRLALRPLDRDWEIFHNVGNYSSLNKGYVQEWITRADECLIGIVFWGKQYWSPEDSSARHWLPRLMRPLDPSRPVGGALCAAN